VKLDWTIEQSNVLFNVDQQAMHFRPYAESKVLYRSDTLVPLSVVLNWKQLVCNNTLQMATRDSSGAVKVPHSTRFDPKAVKETLGIGFSRWDSFMQNLQQLSQRPVSAAEADRYLCTVLNEPVLDDVDSMNSKVYQQVNALYQGNGMGSELSGSAGTAWGLLNAVTEYVDHHRRSRNQDNRLDSAWFGPGSQLKQRALDEALTLLQ